MEETKNANKVLIEKPINERPLSVPVIREYSGSRA
jgi:hypothetical protein